MCGGARGNRGKVNDTTKLLSDDIHGGEDGFFVVIVISDVPKMESAHQYHRQRNLSKHVNMRG
jgi:hypothetical protein